MWQISTYLREPTRATQTNQMTHKVSRKYGILVTYCQVVFRYYAPEDFVAAAECAVTCCVQGDLMTDA